MELVSWVNFRDDGKLIRAGDRSLVAELVEDGLRTVVVVCFIIPYEYIVDRSHESDGIERVGLTWSSFPGSTSGMTGS